MVWKSSSHAKYDCKYHLVWSPKRRWRIEGADIREWIDKTIREIADEFEFDIEEMEIAPDHVHIFLGFLPRYSIAKVVGIIKSISTSRTFKRFAWLRKKCWSGELWEDGYAVRTVGDKVTSEWIKRYIRRHEKRTTNQTSFL